MARYLISEAARQTGVEAHVLRYWEEELELEIPRNELGHRYYTEEHIEIFNHIKEMKAEGYQLRAIKESLARAAAARREKLLQDERQIESGEDEMSASERGISGKGTGEQLDKPAVALTEEKEQAAARLRGERLVEFESIVYDIVTEALRNNNERLGREVSDRVGDKVVKEMNYLMREQDIAQEERYKKLDAAIRGNLRRKGLFSRKRNADMPADTKISAADTKGKKGRDKTHTHELNPVRL